MEELVDIEDEEVLVIVIEVELEAVVEVAVLTEPNEKVRRVPSVTAASVDRCEDVVDEVELEDEVGDAEPEEEELLLLPLWAMT